MTTTTAPAVNVSLSRPAYKPGIARSALGGNGNGNALAELTDAIKGGNARSSLRRVSSTVADEIAALKRDAGPTVLETEGGGGK